MSTTLRAAVQQNDEGFKLRLKKKLIRRQARQQATIDPIFLSYLAVQLRSAQEAIRKVEGIKKSREREERQANSLMCQRLGRAKEMLLRLHCLYPPDRTNSR